VHPDVNGCLHAEPDTSCWAVFDDAAPSAITVTAVCTLHQGPATSYVDVHMLGAPNVGEVASGYVCGVGYWEGSSADLVLIDTTPQIVDSTSWSTVGGGDYDVAFDCLADGSLQEASGTCSDVGAEVGTVAGTNIGAPGGDRIGMHMNGATSCQVGVAPQ